NGFAAYPELVQWYEWLGVLGGSLWIWVVNLLIWDKWAKPIFESNTAFKQRTAWILPLAFAVLPMGTSLLRFATFSQTGPSVEVVALQPNLDPYIEKFKIPASEMTQQLLAWSEPYISNQTR